MPLPPHDPTTDRIVITWRSANWPAVAEQNVMMLIQPEDMNLPLKDIMARYIEPAMAAIVNGARQ